MVVALWLLAALLWAGLHWIIVPRIDDFRPRVERLASQALGLPVRIGALHAESNGLMPTVSVHALQVLDAAGQPGLSVQRALATVSMASLLRGQLAQLVIEQPALELHRDGQGRIRLAGLELASGAGSHSAALDWVFTQEEIALRGGRLRWIDAAREGPPLVLSQIDAVLQNGPRRHQFRVDATPETAWGERFTLTGQFRQRWLTRAASDWRGWTGRLHASAPRLEMGRWAGLGDWPAGWSLDQASGAGAVRLWLDWSRGEVVGASADVALGPLALTLGERLAPLALQQLQGRLDWQRQGEGFEIATHGLQFTEADGTVWPGGNVRFSQRAGTPDVPVGGELQGGQLDLAALVRLADRLPLPAAVHSALQGQRIAGRVQNLSAHWSGTLPEAQDWRVQLRASDLIVGARVSPAAGNGGFHAGVPGVEGATLQLDAGPTGGQASLRIDDGALEFPGVFEAPHIALAELAAQVRWRVEGERIALEVPELTLRNADATGRFSAQWHSGDTPTGEGPRFPGTMDLQGVFSRASAAAVHRYLPLSLPAAARHYVRDAVKRGEGRNIAVQVKGKLREVPFNLPGEKGEFRFAGPVSGVTLAYVPPGLQPAGQAPWPALESLAGELVFERAGMRVNAASARVQGHPGWRFDNIQTEIADFKHTRVQVQGNGSGALATALEIVRSSPVAAFTQHALDQTHASGDTALTLTLDLPIEHLEQSKVQGRVTLAGNDLQLSPTAPRLAQARGAVHFWERGFAIEQARVQLLGGTAVVSGGSTDGAGEPAVRVRAQGQASAEGLRAMADWGPVATLARHASGQADYAVQIDFDDGATPALSLESDLQGLAIDLPVPLGKRADARWPLRYTSGPLPTSQANTPVRERLQVRVADVLALDYEHAGTPARVLRGAAALGSAAIDAMALPASGVRAWVDVAQLDADAWLRLASAPSADGSDDASPLSDALPSQWSLRIGALTLGGRQVHDVVAQATRAAERWGVDVQARELAGRIEYDGSEDGGAGRLHARLARLRVPEAAGDASDSRAEPPRRLPALDVVIDDFEVDGKKLGRLQVQAVNRAVTPTGSSAADGALREWQLSHLALDTPEARLSASGHWRDGLGTGTGAQRRTALDFRLDIHDAGALLARFGMVDVLRRGQGHIEGHLGWGGSPLSPHYPSMAGQLHLDVGAGQFLKADPGIAKLLGVLSLQALPRRLSLDFRDVFSSGFAFDSIRGDARVARGVASTDNLQMKGVNAAVLMDGSADLDHETQNLRVLVVPEIDAGTAALAVAAINPAVGLGAFLAQLVLKGPLAQAATREFQITGRWDNPEITQVKSAASPGENR